MPGRIWPTNGDKDYRFGFQNQEQDKEFYDGAVSYKYRIHDPRIGRFFAVDPLTSKYPHYTPYSFSGNKVIDHVELEGLEEFDMRAARWAAAVTGENIIIEVETAAQQHVGRIAFVGFTIGLTGYGGGWFLAGGWRTVFLGIGENPIVAEQIGATAFELATGGDMGPSVNDLIPPGASRATREVLVEVIDESSDAVRGLRWATGSNPRPNLNPNRYITDTEIQFNPRNNIILEPYTYFKQKLSQIIGFFPRDGSFNTLIPETMRAYHTHGGLNATIGAFGKDLNAAQTADLLSRSVGDSHLADLFISCNIASSNFLRNLSSITKRISGGFSEQISVAKNGDITYSSSEGFYGIFVPGANGAAGKMIDFRPKNVKEIVAKTEELIEN